MTCPGVKIAPFLGGIRGVSFTALFAYQLLESIFINQVPEMGKSILHSRGQQLPQSRGTICSEKP